MTAAAASPFIAGCAPGVVGTPPATALYPHDSTQAPAPYPTLTLPPRSGSFFRLHPFIEAHPEAVFIKQTHVSDKTDEPAKQREGTQLARELFVFGTNSGIPLSHKIAIKPNLTCTRGQGGTPDGMGIITDRSFVEGLVEGMKGAGFKSDNLFVREGNWLKDGYCAQDLQVTGYEQLAERTGIHLLDLPTGRRLDELTLDRMEADTEVVWKDVPDGVVFRRIGYVAPFNHADSWLLNVAKLKAHGMGMTLCVKNLQGMCVSPYVHFCDQVEEIKNHPPAVLNDFHPDFVERIAELHDRHVGAGIPRWDRENGPWMERWAQRTCDSLSVTQVGLNIIEGIYGRNGDGFLKGPGEYGQAEDFMSNVLIFGRDPFRVDLVGFWLAGHEPGNFGLFHIARERGLLSVLNPREIPVYRWVDGQPAATSFGELERVPLKTYYLRRDYAGQTEPLYHMVDEPFAY